MSESNKSWNKQEEMEQEEMEQEENEQNEPSIPVEMDPHLDIAQQVIEINERMMLSTHWCANGERKTSNGIWGKDFKV